MNALLKYGGAVLASVLLVVVIATVAGAIFGDAPTATTPVVAERPAAPAAPPRATPPATAPAPLAAAPDAPPAPAAIPAPALLADPMAAAPAPMADPMAAAPAPAVPPPAAGAPGAVAAGTANIAGRLAAANAATGLTVRTRCAACHTFDQNGPNRVGPNLWNVVGRDKASVPGFNFSEALKNAPGTWTFDELDKFLTAPAQHTPGTRMNFAGMPSAADRANLIAHLRTLSTAPVPLPAN